MAQYVKEVNDAYLSDNIIDEMGVILSSSGPSIFVTEHKLGISMTILKPMFAYAVPELYRLRSMLDEDMDVEIVQNIRMVSLAALLVKGDFPPALDIRKMLILKDALSVEDEIRLTGVIFSKHPKSPSCWYHRKWCILHRKSIITQECELCSRMCDVYPRNYYAWNHRLWIVGYMNETKIHEELHNTLLWLKKHVSDHSAVNHFSQVLFRALNMNESQVSRQLELLEHALESSMRIAFTCAGHEALWYLRRMISTVLCQCVQRWVQLTAISLGELATSVLPSEGGGRSLDLDTARSLLRKSLDSGLDAESGRDAGGSDCSGSEDEGDVGTSEEDTPQIMKRAVHMLFKGLRQLLHLAPGSEDTSGHHCVSSGALDWFVHWVNVEINFFVRCTSDSMSWDPTLQKRHGRAFLTHLFSCIMRVLVVIDGVDHGVLNGDVSQMIAPPCLLSVTSAHGIMGPPIRSQAVIALYNDVGKLLLDASSEKLIHIVK